jgi:hypothetical protein
MLARRGGASDRQRARQLLAAALETAEQLEMKQVCTEVVAAQALLDPVPGCAGWSGSN